MRRASPRASRGGEAGTRSGSARSCPRCGTLDRADEIAALALANRDAGVVGFDIAGPEDGFPPSRHASAFDALRRAQLPRAPCTRARPRASTRSPRPSHVAGALPARARRAASPDDVAPTSSATGSACSRTGSATAASRSSCARRRTCRPARAPRIAEHPVTRLRALGLRRHRQHRQPAAVRHVAVPRARRSWSQEAGWTLADLEDVTVTAAAHSFVHHDERVALIDTVIRPAYAAARRRKAPRMTPRHRCDADARSRSSSTTPCSSRRPPARTSRRWSTRACGSACTRCASRRRSCPSTAALACMVATVVRLPVRQAPQRGQGRRGGARRCATAPTRSTW